MGKNAQTVEARPKSSSRKKPRAIQILMSALAGIFVLVALVAALVVTRQALARAQVDREWQAVTAPVPNLQETTRLDILPIYDAAGSGAGLEPGFGVSYLLRTDSAIVLMDLGNNPDESEPLPAAENLAALGVDWSRIDAIVISHPHPDHVGGTAAWQQKTIALGKLAGDLSGKPIYVPIPMTDPRATLTYSPQPVLVTKDVATTGTISYPEVFPLSVLEPKGYEQAVVVDVTGQGLVVITGCGHPTLERLVSRAETLFRQPVVGVVGGLHYKDGNGDVLRPHVEFLKARSIDVFALSPHDSGANAIATFQAAFPDAYEPIRVGEAIQFP